MPDDPINESTPQFDEGIHCPECDYNLTGITSERCPECGHEFDRLGLLEQAESPSYPIPIWNNRNRLTPVVAYLLVTKSVLVNPIRYAHSLPANPDWRSTRLFAVCSYVFAATLMLGASALSQTMVAGRVVLSLSWLIGAFVCEFAVAIFLPINNSPALSLRVDHLNRSRSIAAIGSCFLVMTATAIAVEFYFDRNPSLPLPDGTLLPVIGLTIWWWAVLFILASQMGINSRKARLMLIIVPFAVGVGFMCGYMSFILISLVDVLLNR